MYISYYLSLSLIFSVVISSVHSWTDDDLELFDLVESTDRKFYDILGVDQKASASDIRKAYRKLSQVYHPDRNKAPDAEETFRKIAAIADVLRNEEQRKKYDVILQTGLPDWREPVYYYRRVRNMGLVELVIFLFCLATVGQYLFAWSAYWEKKYELEELMSARLKKKAKHLKKGKITKTTEEIDLSPEEILPKPRYQDLFVVRLVIFFIHIVTSSPSYLKLCVETIHLFCQKKKEIAVEEESEEETEVRVRVRKHVQHQQPQYPEYSNLINENIATKNLVNGVRKEGNSETKESSHLTEADMGELKKAMKKFPHGSLQRWEKIAAHLNCPISEAVSMAKQMKVQEFVAKDKLALLEMQGISGLKSTMEVNGECGAYDQYEANDTLHVSKHKLKPLLNGNGTMPNHSEASHVKNVEDKVWKQEEQRSLELALQKFPKDTTGRWDRIAEFVQTKSKEECVIRYKELAQQIKKKRGKEN